MREKFSSQNIIISWIIVSSCSSSSYMQSYNSLFDSYQWERLQNFKILNCSKSFMIFFFFFSYFLLSFATSQEIFKFSWWIFLSVFEMIEIDWHERDEKIRKKKKKECFDARVRKFTLIHLCVNFLIIYNIRSDHELFLLVYYT